VGDVKLESSQFDTIEATVNPDHGLVNSIQHTLVLNGWVFKTSVEVVITDDADVNFQTRYGLNDNIVKALAVIAIVKTAAKKGSQKVGAFFLKLA